MFINLLRVKHSILLVIIVLIMQGCGGGSSSDSPVSSTDETSELSSVSNNTLPIYGAGVNGPLRFAKVSAHTLNLATGEISDVPVAIGTTNERAEISGLSIPKPVTFPYIIKFTVTEETRLPDGTKSQLHELNTIIFDASTPVYATVLTTLAINLANKTIIGKNQAADLLIYKKYIDNAAKSITDTFGFSLLNKIDIFTTPPLIFKENMESEQIQKAINYRTASNAAVKVVLSLVGDNAKVKNIDDIIKLLVSDLLDGIIDSREFGKELIYAQVANNDITQFITSEVSGADSTSEVAFKLLAEQIITSNDYLNLVSHTPAQPKVQFEVDIDGDGWLISQDTDDDDKDYPGFSFVDTDGDGLANVGGKNPDSDDDNDGIPDTDDPYPSNSPPTYSNLSILPQIATTNSALSIGVLIKDTDSADSLLRGENFWFINGQRHIGQSEWSLEPEFTKKGDIVSLHLVFSDGYNEVTTEIVTRTIVNSPPTVTAIKLTPERPIFGDDIQVSLIEVDDLDNDNLNYLYSWTINGSAVDNNLATLAAELFELGDLIAISIAISDGYDEVKVSSNSITIEEPSIEVSISSLPTNTDHKTELLFDVVATNYLGEQQPLEVSYGPSGMSINAAGLVSWTPNEIMLDKTEEFKFAFNVVGNKESMVVASVIVEDVDRKQPMSRSGIEVPYKNHSIWVDDYNNDGENEILLTDSQNLVFTLKYSDGDYYQDWMYPFSIPGNKKIVQVLSHDVNNNQRPDIIIITMDTVSIIEDREGIAQLKLQLEESEGEFIAAAVANIDDDAAIEIAVISSKYGEYKLTVYQLDNMKIEFSFVLNNKPEAVVIGNLDTDDAKEIVLSNGYVFDGQTGENQWYFSGGFGSRIDVGDVDGSGIDIIIATNGWAKPKAYSAIHKSELWEIDKEDVCSIKVNNIDDEVQEEVLIGQCQWRNVIAYDIGGGNPVEQIKWDSVGHGSISLAVGDTDNDSDIEIIWGSGISSSGEDVLVIAQANISEPVNWTNTNPSQLDRFKSTGWAQIQPGNEKAVFLAPKSDSGYAGQRIITMDRDGTLEIGEEVSSNWDAVSSGQVADYNKDGYAELFFGVAHIRSGELQVRQIDNNSILIGGGLGDRESSITAINISDVNNDSYEDVIYVDSGKVNVLDVYNQRLIWTSTTFNHFVSDILSIPDMSGRSKILIAADEDLSIWVFNSDKYLRENTAQITCARVQIADLDNDGSKEILCLKRESYYFSKQTTISVYNSELTLIHTHEFDLVLTDFIVDGRNILAASKDNLNSDYSNMKSSSLLLISPVTGNVIWQSQAINGYIPTRSMHHIPQVNGENKTITFASEDAMYITN